MAESPESRDADLLCVIVKKIFDNPGLVAKIPVEKRLLWHLILERTSLIASRLTRNDPKVAKDDEAKSTRIKRKSFFYTGYDTLVRLCFFELITIVPESPWTDEDAALFLRTLESIHPVFSRLFTKVFDDLIDLTKLQKHFLETGDYLSYSSHFSNTIFLSLSKVVRPKSPFECPERTVQCKYGLKYHYRYPMTSNQLFKDLRQALSTATNSTEV